MGELVLQRLEQFVRGLAAFEGHALGLHFNPLAISAPAHGGAVEIGAHFTGCWTVGSHGDGRLVFARAQRLATCNACEHAKDEHVGGLLIHAHGC